MVEEQENVQLAVKMVHCISVIDAMINDVGLVYKKLVVPTNHAQFVGKNKISELLNKLEINQ